jgi:hypothetical protein
MNFDLSFLDALKLLGGAVLFLYVFFFLYVGIMGLYRAHLDGVLTKPGYVLGAPWLLIGYVFDVVANFTIFVVIFLEPPQELLVTSRLQRYLRDPDLVNTWRWRVAHQICSKLLDYLDPHGKHC